MASPQPTAPPCLHVWIIDPQYTFWERCLQQTPVRALPGCPEQTWGPVPSPGVVCTTRPAGQP